jgi:hypothetical protein
MSDALRRPLPPSVFARLADAARYVITGVSPDTWFGPLQPLQPMAPPEVKGRRWDYPFGANLNYIPRADDGVSFAELRGLADALPLLRAVIETRKDQIAAQSYAIRPRDRKASPAASQAIEAVTRFLARPDRRHSFADWLRMLLEDMLVIDAATLYPRYNRGGSLYALDVIDGATIKPLIGEDGRAPEPPDPAYQQILKGVPAADFSVEELLYLPRNVRAHRLYGMSPVEARDQSQIEIFGPRVGSTIQGHEICDEFVIGPLVAQTILQRGLYVRTKFTFKLSWEYCLLDPMDIVSLTDTNLGLSNYLVRIIQIEEDDKGLLSFTCEELVAGVSNPALNPSASSTGFQPNWGVPAVPVNTPLIYQPPAVLTGGVEQIWLGASGINAGGGQIGNTQGAQWGGASVYASVDDVTYAQIGVITAPLRQGFLTSSLAAAGGWDPVNTLAVNLAESVQPGTAALNGTSQAAAQAGATLSLVDQELLAYEVAALSGGTAYNLTGLARGLSGSTPTFHSSGAPFARLDGAVLRFDVPANFQGQTVWFKFQSFNILGGGIQDLSTCIAFQFNITAPPTAHPITTQLDSGFPLDLGQVISAPTVSDDFGYVASDPVVDTIDLGAIAVTVTHPIAVQLLSGTPLDLGLTTQAVTVSDDFGSTNDAVVDVINLGTVP